MHEAYKDRVAFLLVYIREAHPDDEWQVGENRRDSVVFAQPRSIRERQEVAHTCSKSLRLTMPCVADEMDNHVENAYAAWPERLFIVDTEGRVAYAGGQGPWGFEPKHIRKWLRKNVGRAH